jgi:hypothetical protein
MVYNLIGDESWSLGLHITNRLTRGIAANVNVGFKVRDDILIPCPSLDVDGFEEERKSLLKPCLRARAAIRNAARPEAM